MLQHYKSDYDMVDDDKKISRKPVSGWHFVAPLLAGFGYLFVRWIINDNTESARWYDGFLWVFLYILIAGIISAAIFWALLNKYEKKEGVRYNGRAFCREKIRKELQDVDRIKIQFFTDVQDSHRDIGFYGADGKSLIYSEIVKTKRIPPGYMFVAMRMEEGLEDRLSYRNMPMNFSEQNLKDIRYSVCNRMANKPERHQSKEIIQTDEMAGRSRHEKTEIPYDPDEEEFKDLE